MHDPQDLALLGIHCQHGLQQHPMLFLVLKGSGSGGGGMMRIVEIGGILDQQHSSMAARLLLGLLHMGMHQPFVGHIWRFQQAIGGLEFGLRFHHPR